MSGYLLAGAEGEQALHTKALDLTVGNDGIRRGSVKLTHLQTMDHVWTGVNDTWVHLRLDDGTNNFSASLDIADVEIIDSNGNVILEFRTGFYLQFGAGRHRDYQNISYASSSGGALTSYPKNFNLKNPSDFINRDLRFNITTVTNPDDTLTITYYQEQQVVFTKTLTDATGWAKPEGLIIQPSSNSTRYVQDVIVTDSVPTVGVTLVPVIANAQGNYTAYVNDFASVNEAGYNPVTSIGAAASGDRESWMHAATAFDLSLGVISGLLITAVGSLDPATGITDMGIFTRDGGVDYDQTALGFVATIPTPKVTFMPTNPATAVQWTPADVTALELGIRAI